MAGIDWTTEATDDLRTEVARLEADRDHWKARAEAAEAKCRLLVDAAPHHVLSSYAYRARIAELEARLARVPDREAVARAIYEHETKYARLGPEPWAEAWEGARIWSFRVADAAIAAMQGTQSNA